MRISKNKLMACIALLMLASVPEAWCSRDVDDAIEHKVAQVLDHQDLEDPAHRPAHAVSKQVALQSARVSLADVIKAQEAATGAKVVMVEVKPFSLTQGPICYELILAKDRTVTQIFVNVTDGRVLEQRKPLWGHVGFSAWGKSRALGQVLVPMGQAIRLAETQFGGKAAKVEVCVEGGAAFYQIELLKDLSLRPVQVDSYMGTARELAVGSH